jgi:hypothetical protein
MRPWAQGAVIRLVPQETLGWNATAKPVPNLAEMATRTAETRQAVLGLEEALVTWAMCSTVVAL